MFQTELSPTYFWGNGYFSCVNVTVSSCHNFRLEGISLKPEFKSKNEFRSKDQIKYYLEREQMAILRSDGGFSPIICKSNDNRGSKIVSFFDVKYPTIESQKEEYGNLDLFLEKVKRMNCRVCARKISENKLLVLFPKAEGQEMTLIESKISF
jgi:hypothetical protein